MLKNFTPRRYYDHVEHSLEWTDKHGNGFSFPCDPAGNVNISDLPREAMENLTYCMQHPGDFYYAGTFRTRKWRCHDEAHGTCSCGREVTLWNQYRGACECECGKWYNLFGQELNPPEYWENDDYDPEEYFRDYEEEEAW